MRPIHPFPARMAPDAASKWLQGLSHGSLIVDPMCGSGVVLRQAIALGHHAKGFDIDPLAVLMSRVWTSGLDMKCLPKLADMIVKHARRKRAKYTSLPVVSCCQETKTFIEYWFAEPQRTTLSRISMSLMAHQDSLERHHLDALLLSLSRTIVTKQSGASLAWDVSHSRPHKKKERNDYDVEAGFLRSATRISEILSQEKFPTSAVVERKDCRALESLGDGCADAVITSPPYLNAIDYLRGHKLALVWMGFTIPYLRSIRASSVGTENTGRGINKYPTPPDVKVEEILPEVSSLPIRNRNIIQKYTIDSWLMLKEMKRILKPDGRVVLVVADSVVRGTEVKSSSIFGSIAAQHGFRPVSREGRAIPHDRRYLPINSSNAALKRRMQLETIQVFERSSA